MSTQFSLTRSFYHTSVLFLILNTATWVDTVSYITCMHVSSFKEKCKKYKYTLGRYNQKKRKNCERMLNFIKGQLNNLHRKKYKQHKHSIIPPRECQPKDTENFKKPFFDIKRRKQKFKKGVDYEHRNLPLSLINISSSNRLVYNQRC